MSVRTFSLLGLFIAIVFGNTVPIATKALYEEGWTPLALYLVTLLIMLAVLSIHELISLERGVRWGMTRKDLAGTIISAITGGVLDPILFFTGMTMVTASNAILMTSLLPFFIVVFSIIFLKEHFTLQTAFGGLAIVAGVAALLWKDLGEFQIDLGSVFLVGATMFGALTTIVHKKFVQHRHLDSVIFVRIFLTTIMVALWTWYKEPDAFVQLQNPQNMWLLLMVPTLGFLVPYFLYFQALRNIQATEAGIMAAVGRVAGVIGASYFLGEALTPQHGVSLVLILVGILTINIPLTKWKIVPSRLPELGPLRR